MTRTTSPAGRAAIMQREGVRLTAYRDSVGRPTIGVGHYNATPPVTHMGMTITMAQCDALLTADLAPMERAVDAADPVGCLSQNAFDAAVSLAFNIGAEGFAGSTVARRIANGDMPGAADAFLMWANPPELLGRRRAERAQFLRPDAGLTATAAPTEAAHMNDVPDHAADDVREVQRRLNLAGYAIKVDGFFGPATENAVREFQSAHRLVPDGIVGPATYAALDVVAAVPSASAVLPKVSVPPVPYVPPAMVQHGAAPLPPAAPAPKGWLERFVAGLKSRVGA